MAWECLDIYRSVLSQIVLCFRQFLKGKYRGYLLKVLNRYDFFFLSICLSAPLFCNYQGPTFYTGMYFQGRWGKRAKFQTSLFSISFLHCKVCFMQLSVLGFHNLLMQNRLRRAMNVTNHMLPCFPFFFFEEEKFSLQKEYANLPVHQN